MAPLRRRLSRHMQKVTVRVPASTSNIGPGFDCLGLALRLANDVTVARGSGRRVTPMMGEAGAAFFRASGQRTFRFTCSVTGNVPQSRGLGSSVTARLGLLHGLNELCDRPLPGERLFDICAKLEGHPDNAAPAEWGGFVVTAGRHRHRFPVSARLKFVLLIPAIEVRTDEARRLLPENISHDEAVANMANACAITAAFASRNYTKLDGAFTDHLHQPFRKHLVPRFDDVIAAARRAGALDAFLSGSGSTIAAVTLRAPRKVAAAMLSAFAAPDARAIVTTADNRGVRVLQKA